MINTIFRRGDPTLELPWLHQAVEVFTGWVNDPDSNKHTDRNKEIATQAAKELAEMLELLASNGEYLADDVSVMPNVWHAITIMEAARYLDTPQVIRDIDILCRAAHNEYFTIASSLKQCNVII